jgi:1,4-dihydroxy-2-naphthoate octaprenyltransferase
MQPVARTALGLYLEIRVIPVLLWSFTGITLGTALAWAEGAPQRLGHYLAAVAVGLLLQGVVAHTVNDIADWRSGTDRDPASRTISGGSGTLTGGYLRERHLVVACVVAIGLSAALGLVLAASRGWWLIAFGAAGLVGAVLYTLPPVRLAYRPFAGEAAALVCVWACGAGAYALQAGALTSRAALAATPHAAGCVAMLMVHHYLDRGPDSRARPPKVTSVVRLGRRARRYACAWGAAAVALAVAVAVVADPAFAVLSAAAAVALAAHAGVAPDDPESVTRSELVVIACGIVGGLGTAAVLATPLVWTVPAAAALAAADLAVAGRAGAPRPETVGAPQPRKSRS